MSVKIVVECCDCEEQWLSTIEIFTSQDIIDVCPKCFSGAYFMVREVNDEEE